MRKISTLMLLLLLWTVTACAPEVLANDDAATEMETAVSTTEPVGMGQMGQGRGRGMGKFHHAPIPEEYAGLTNPIPADEESIVRGGETYATHCATCHGDGGMGDGPGGASLDPSPVAIAHTSQMMGDDYLFWRVSEGGLGDPFNTGMIPWGGILTEDQRWDVLNYVQALGNGQTMPAHNAGGAAFDEEEMTQQKEEMLATAVAETIITEEQAAVFASAHKIVDAAMMDKRGNGGGGGMGDMMTDTLSELVTAGDLTQSDADTFLLVHDLLEEAGLMN